MTLNNGTAASHGPTAGAARKPGYAGTLAATSCAVFVAQVANALPASLNGLFQEDLNTHGSQLTWITAAFMIAVVCFEFTFGVLGDRFGRKKLITAGAAFVAAGSTVAAVAPTVQVLWIGAALNGLGAGALFPGSLTMLASVTRNARERAQAVALWSGFLSAGAALSPLLGGVFATYGSWRGSFLVLVGLATLSVLFTLRLTSESRSPEKRELDVPGQITFAIGLVLVLYAAVEGPEAGWTTLPVILSGTIGITFLAGFVLVEVGAKSPIFDLSLFRNRAFTVSSVVAVIGMLAFLGACFATSMWLGPIQHQDPLRVAVPFLLLQGPAFVLIPVVSRLLHRVAPAWLLASGFLLMTVGCLLASRLDITDTGLTAFVVPHLLIGIGFALCVSSVTAVALDSVPPQLAGMASATTNMLRDLGFALGPVVVGAIALSKAGTAFTSRLEGADLPAEHLRAARGIAAEGGPIAVNSLPPGAPGSAAHDLALEALGSGFGNAFLVCGTAAGAAAVLTAVGMIGVRPARSSPAQSPAGSSAFPGSSATSSPATERYGAPEPTAR
ncbi:MULTISPECIES: MFS transporter [Streptomyces]|uniref:MFS transporter n=1 Tax=Streptomyces TaxID=1883 RepID=UPI00081AFEDF|nr:MULTISPECIES: MFS transporter [unclassified Streptomyces]MYQ52189.1 MFS transporter [Streptomyces sp. SID4941]SCD77206.1 Major Facilitator Superfamily protein [Streptomyces sp. PalvLS-984]SDB89464.1 Sugar phosphate permease [Streptomyces sp. AmelKG-A3]